VENILKKRLKQEKVNYHSITSRAKSIEKYMEKASKEKYKDPRSEIVDMAGVRIITYLDSDVKKVEEIVKSTFEIIPEHSIDKSQKLGTDKVGYRSIHCVCTLGKARTGLPENEDFSKCCFEIQIRTLLQHAWAEFEHDRNYKFKGILPSKLKRRLAIVAGNLEFIDWAFESIAKSIDEYTYGVQQKTAKGNLNTRITSASLQIYLGRKFEDLVKKGLQTVLLPDTIIKELSILNISTLEELDKAIPKDFVQISLKYNCISSYASVLRDIMIIFDAKNYFEKAWQNSWHDLSPESIELLEHYSVPISKYIETYNLYIEENLPEYDPLDFEPPEYEPDYEPPEYEEDYEPPEYEEDYEPPEHEEEQPE